MTEGQNPSAALLAAQAADAQVAACIAGGESFLLEAGAGAGKTYSLVETLKGLIASHEAKLRLRGQRIACITYTNAATAVINSRIDGNPIVLTDTIHAFCWSLIKQFQGVLKQLVPTLDNWPERIAESQIAVASQRVEYELGYRRINDTTISLHHDDVLSLAAKLLIRPKFQAVLADRFPYLLIDEYQDTNQAVMDAIKENLIGRPGGPLVGLFGDHWQRIYEDTCGHVADPDLKEIGKKANFRSATAIVDVLNAMRPALPQAVDDVKFIGSAVAFHTNGWVGQRRPGTGGGHWKGDLPAEEAHRFLEAMVAKLANEGWDFAADKTKILMLTHNVLANEQGYSNLAKVFPYTDLYIKKQDDYIAFFVEKLEPACDAFSRRRYGEMFELLGSTAPRFESHNAKLKWSASMAELAALRGTGTVGDVIAHIDAGGSIRLPEKILMREKEAKEFVPLDGESVPSRIELTRKLRNIFYSEVIALDKFINGHTPFATKHSVKGDQFENVLVVLGRGWNVYNFGQYLDWAKTGQIPADKQDAFERYRNLLYVACSRPTTRLALLFTQELTDQGIATLHTWFGDGSVHAFRP
ncbi:UvrD-helicase domain-containing protein [Acidovorax sp. NCPPB 3576]|uniref:UvrD-helicase domain-containing protein n=1 Tax=Acidovorax sp. NCPPB 3576 TaxID=2940488 RepID=UPI0023491489|nr:ATP-dependent helicase [Acidovorax sp. NCPPB 3576]WCM90507.1 ATP-dependent helicase [Acidovorax sp. NCPPB 3576]